MTSLFQARRRAEEFAEAVDLPTRATDRSDEVVELVGVVATLRSHEPVAPRAEFATELRTRLMVEAETSLDPATAQLLLPARERGKRERRLVAAASAFVLIGGTTTMAAAAQNALPGEALYPIKRGLESAQAGLSLSDAGKGQDLLHQASDRLVEVQGLVTADRADAAPQVPATLAAFTESAEEGSTLLLDSFREDSDPEHIVSVRSFTADGIATLESLAGDVPAEAQGDLTAAAVLLQDIDAEAAGLCGTCAPELPEVELPGIFLARAEVDRALLRAGTRDLENSHPVVVTKESVEQVRRPRRPQDGNQGGSQTDGETTVAQPEATAPAAPAGSPLPDPTWEPESWPSLLPGLDSGPGSKDSDGGTDDAPSLEETGKDLNTGLTGVVETILPDPEGDLGLTD